MNHHVSHVFLILNYIACLHKLLLKCNAALTCRIRVLCAYITAQMRIDVVGQNIHIGHDFILQDLCAFKHGHAVACGLEHVVVRSQRIGPVQIKRFSIYRNIRHTVRAGYPKEISLVIQFYTGRN